jgi:tetratricopeptide (TPR) repeat protein
MKIFIPLFVAVLIETTCYSQTIKDLNAIEYCSDGEIKITNQDYRGAIADFNQAIENNPRYSTAYYHRGRAKMYLQDYRGAILDITKVIELNSSYLNTHINEEETNEAIAGFKEINKANAKKELDDAYILRGGAKFAIEDYTGAISDYSKVIELHPRYARVYYLRALAKIEFKQKDSGCLDLSKAGELGFSKAYDAIKQYCN